FGVLIQRITNGGKRRADARVARHHPILDGDIQVFTDQDALAAQVRIRHSKYFHYDPYAFDQATVVSSMRFEKPHSLSYQAQTFTRVPSITLVSVASYGAERGSWLKSTDTSGPSVYWRMPLRAPCEASFSALLISST